MTVTIPAAVAMVLRSFARIEAPREACALLRTHRLPDDEVYIARTVALRNAHPIPEHGFELDPAELRDVLADELAHGTTVADLAFFHSHPDGVGPELSATDRRALDQAAALGHGWLWLILAGDEFRAYSADGEELDVRVEP